MPGGFLSAPVESYLAQLHQAPDAVLAAMQRAGEARGFPIIGPQVGRLCQQLARAIKARSIFEMGSGFGYSTAWFAKVVGPKGQVVHTDGDPTLSAEAKGWLKRARLASRVDFRVGDANQLLRLDKKRHDIVFIDVDKHQYPEAWKIARRRVRRGGLIITDNTLWSGRAADPRAADVDSRGVQMYNQLAFSDPRFLSVLLPVRDGVTVSLRL